jgi:hypothetical protein
LWGLGSFIGVLRDFVKRLLVAEPSFIEIRPIPKNVWPPKWPPFHGGLERIPVGLAERDACYGDPKVSIGASNRLKVSREYARNLATVAASRIPNYHRRVYMATKAAPYFIEAMRRAQEACPDWTPKRIGCFNPRRMRHSSDPRTPLSDHTYGIAFDIDSGQNRAWSRKKHPERPQPFKEGWDEFSDIPEGVVLAFESVGFEWGGRWKSYIDPHHFSLRKVK